MFRKRFLMGLVSLLLLSGLAACGEAPTSTPVPTPTPLPTATAAPTPTSPAVNPAPAGLTPAASGETPVVPAPPEAARIALDVSALSMLLQAAGIPATGASALQINLYASNDDLDTFAAAYSKTLQAANFKPLSIIPGLGGATLLNKQGQQYLGLLTRDDTQALVAVQPYSEDFIKQAASAGIPADVLKSVTDQLNGKKSVAVAVSGSGLLQAFTSVFISGSSPTPSPAPSPTK
jgi:hypothetical protein